MEHQADQLGCCRECLLWIRFLFHDAEHHARAIAMTVAALTMYRAFFQEGCPLEDFDFENYQDYKMWWNPEPKIVKICSLLRTAVPWMRACRTKSAESMERSNLQSHGWKAFKVDVPVAYGWLSMVFTLPWWTPWLTWIATKGPRLWMESRSFSHNRCH
jgi:hypothetical protein